MHVHCVSNINKLQCEAPISFITRRIHYFKYVKITLLFYWKNLLRSFTLKRSSEEIVAAIFVKSGKTSVSPFVEFPTNTEF